MVYRFFVYMFVISIFFCYQEINALSLGSNTVVSRQGYAIFPSGATDNMMKGYALFENGFKLFDASTTCTFDSLFPVSGVIDLMGGSLYLMESLTLANTTRINTMGNLYGNGKTLKLAQSITELRSTRTELMLTLTNYNMGTAVSGVDFSQNYSYALAVAASNLKGPEICMFSFDGVRLTVTAQFEYGRNSNCCRWQPGKTNFVVGILSGVNAQLFSYAYNRSNGQLTQVDFKNLSSGQAINALAYSPGGNYLLAGRSTSQGGNKTELFMFSVSSGGLLTSILDQYLPGGDHDVSINGISWSPGGNYLAVGTTALCGAPDLLIYHFDGTTLTPTIQLTIGLTSRGVDWSPTGTFIAVAFTGSTTQNLMIYTHNISNGTLTPQPSANINQTTDALSVAWTADGNRLLLGTALAGGIGSFRQYAFNKTETTLSLINTQSYNGHVSAMRVLQSNDQYIIGIGTYVYISSSGYTAGFTLTVDDLTISLGNNITLGTPIGFSGDCMIEGNNHAIDFDVTGTMIVLPHSKLYLKDLMLKNFGGTQVQCLDNSATILLDNVTMYPRSSYYFDAGALQIYNDFILAGTNPFIYRSSVGSLINKNSAWICDYLSTFSYDPISDNRYGIQMTDRSSFFMMKQASLFTTATGLFFKAGSLLFDGKNILVNRGRSFAEAIQWGDGLTYTNDVQVIMMPDACIDVHVGYCVDKNVLL